MPQDKILVIKLSALGDFIQALGAMRAIRDHHPEAHITCLTTKPFAHFAKICGYFDDVSLDKRPSWLDFHQWKETKNKFKNSNFTRVYDLQNNDRTQLYFKLFPTPKPEWVGTALGASHRNTDRARTQGHAFDGHKQTLALAGITDIQIDPMDWMVADISRFALKKPYALLVAGSAPKHPYKRWPAKHYAALANSLLTRGLQPVLLGTLDDAPATQKIMDRCPDALNLTAKTTLEQIATLARGAALAVGNDTGPMHLIAATGCPSLSLFSGRTNPVKHAPLGAHVTILQEDNLADLSPETVIETALSLLKNTKNPTKEITKA